VSVDNTPRQLDDEVGPSVSRRRREVKHVREWEIWAGGVWPLPVAGCVAYGFIAFRHEPGSRRILLLAKSNKPSKPPQAWRGQKTKEKLL
jgi:hypothetical protein